jgi:hypothetical protein
MAEETAPQSEETKYFSEVEVYDVIRNGNGGRIEVAQRKSDKKELNGKRTLEMADTAYASSRLVKGVLAEIGDKKVAPSKLIGLLKIAALGIPEEKGGKFYYIGNDGAFTKSGPIDNRIPPFDGTCSGDLEQPANVEDHEVPPQDYDFSHLPSGGSDAKPTEEDLKHL